MRWIPIVFALLSVAVLSGADGAATKANAPVRAECGKAVRYADSPITFPAFVIHFLKREEFKDPVARRTYLFEVTDLEGKKVAEPRFQMAGVYRNELAFTVRGKTIVIEKFYTAAGLALPFAERNARRLGDDELVVWDESSAKMGNFHLFEIGFLKPVNWLVPVNK
jgi:hypothetical protein